MLNNYKNHKIQIIAHKSIKLNQQMIILTFNRIISKHNYKISNSKVME